MEGQDSGVRLAKRIDVLVTAWLLVCVAILMKLPGGAQNWLGEALRGSVLRPFVVMNVTYAKARTVARDFDLQRAHMDSLLSRVAAQRVLAEENRQLRALLGLRESAPRRYVATPVIRSGAADGSVFRVAVGSDDGVRPFHAVVTEAGLLGQVQRVDGRSASALDWSHPGFRVSAMTPDGTVHGLVMAERGRFREQDRLLLSGTAYLSDLEAGTALVTSGRGGTYARGILVGWITEVAATMAGWSKSYHVEPAVQPGAATYALVDLGEQAEPDPAEAEATGDPGGSVGSDEAAGTRGPRAPEAGRDAPPGAGSSR